MFDLNFQIHMKRMKIFAAKKSDDMHRKNVFGVIKNKKTFRCFMCQVYFVVCLCGFISSEVFNAQTCAKISFKEIYPDNCHLKYITKRNMYVRTYGNSMYANVCFMEIQKKNNSCEI